MSKKSLRVHVVTYEDGNRTGKLLRTWDSFFDRPAPSAYGATMEDVLAELEAKLEALSVESSDTPDAIERFLWEETFETQRVRVDIHPLTTIKKRPVIGKKEIPLLLSYVYCPLKGGGFRVMLPRFGLWFIVEELSLAPEVIRNALAAFLVGENARWVYEFRQVEHEVTVEWSPPLLLKIRERAGNAESADPHVELLRVADDLVARASKGKLLPVVGDSSLFDRIKHLTVSEKPPSILLVGPEGVGKSALVRRMASHHVSVRKDHKTALRIYSTSRDRIVAGMVYLGMWQERCLKLVRELTDEGDYLHVSSLAGILEAQPDGAAIADFLEPAMPELRLIVESTQEELERARRARPSFIRRFTIVHVDEPSPAETTSLALAYASKRGLAIHPSAMKRLLRHLTVLERGISFPGKAFRFVDWLTSSLSPSSSPPSSGARTLYPREISEAYSRYSGVPFSLLADDVAASAQELARALRERVIGQDSACDACGRLLARFKANLVDPDRPCGVLLFVGPTGVGKTELAKQLARTTFGDGTGSEGRMIRLDMSEYMLPGSAGRLTATGHGARSLAARVRQQPLSLILLDEIEKAHSEVFDLLLGILGEGRMTDDSGRFVDFRTTLIVMTSNLGVSDTRPAGFAAPGDVGESATFVRKVRAHFRPELFNRIDHVLPFRSLSRGDVERIVDLELDAVSERAGLRRRSLRLEASLSARRRLAELGYHPTRGARPLRRLIEERVMTPIAQKIAGDPSFADRRILVVDDDADPRRTTSNEGAWLLSVAS